MSIKDRLQPASADDVAIALFNFSTHVKPRTQAEIEHLLRQRIFRGDAASVRILIEQSGMDINTHIACNSIPLHLAAGFRQVEVMKDLFKVHGLDINVRNQEGNTPLSNACHAGFAEVVRTLAQATDADDNRMNLDINARNRSGYTPLYLAANAGHAAIVAELLQVPGIDVNARLRYGQTALFATCRRGHAEAAQALLKSKEISDAVEEIVLPGLLDACKFGHVNVVSAILTAPELAGQRDSLSEELVKFSLQIKELNAQNAD